MAGKGPSNDVTVLSNEKTPVVSISRTYCIITQVRENDTVELELTVIRMNYSMSD